ncbi:hypothetical protein TcG_13222, partial [Trypanosoma cruzi]
MRRKNSAPGTHSDCHQQQPQRVSCDSATRQHTEQRPHALPPVILLLSLPAPSTAHRPAQPENPSSLYQQRDKHVGTCSCWARIHVHSSQAPSMPHQVSQLLHAKIITLAVRQQKNRDLSSSLLTTAAAAIILCVHSQRMQ